jgi:hypothetical protein
MSGDGICLGESSLVGMRVRGDMREWERSLQPATAQVRGRHARYAPTHSICRAACSNAIGSERDCPSSPCGPLAAVRTGLNPPTSAPRLGSPLPHLHRDWAHPGHIRTGTGLTPPTSAPRLGSPLPHLHRDWAHHCHICTGTGLAPARSAAGVGPPRIGPQFARRACARLRRVVGDLQQLDA